MKNQLPNNSLSIKYIIPPTINHHASKQSYNNKSPNKPIILTTSNYPTKESRYYASPIKYQQININHKGRRKKIKVLFLVARPEALKKSQKISPKKCGH